MEQDSSRKLVEQDSGGKLVKTRGKLVVCVPAVLDTLHNTVHNSMVLFMICTELNMYIQNIIWILVLLHEEK